MAAPRFFLPETDLAPGVVTLPENEARHAAGPLRLRAGEAAELFDGAGAVACGRIVRIDASRVEVEVEAVRTVPPQRPAVHLAVAVPKGKRLQVMIEKCTELGAASIRFVRFARSVAGGGGQPTKWRRWAVEACKQCRRAHLPHVYGSVTLDEWLDNRPDGLVLVGDPDGMPLREALDAEPPERDIHVLIGPEGGLSDEERQRCAEHDARAVQFSPHVLRIETAAMAGVAGVRVLRGTA